MDNHGKPLAATAGDPSGIGPDVLLATWAARERQVIPPFYVISDPDLLIERAAQLGLDVPVVVVAPADAISRFANALPVSRLAGPFVGRPGESTSKNAAGIIEAIERAVADTLSGDAAGVVTGPIAKKSLYDAGFAFPGHTEFLADLAYRATGRTMMPVMMLAGPELLAVPVTIHVPLAEVPILLTRELVVETVEICARDLRERFKIARPRIAVAGLNPHAGEGGAIGREEIEVIGPAIEQLRARGIDTFGPLPADTMFHARARAAYDVAICMYHDQGLIPAKALAFDDTVNVTLGLPFIRTSPDHGTAFDLAGSGKARPDSFIAALKLAHRLARNTAVVQ